MQRTFAAMAMVIGALVAPSAQGVVFENQKLFAPEPAANAWFGHAVAAAGRTAVVAGSRDAGFTGTAHVYWLFGFGEEVLWLHMAELAASDAGEEDYFGTSLAISEDAQAVLVGAPGQDEFSANCGSAYVFRWNAVTLVWDEEQQLFVNPDCGSNHEVGSVVALSGDVAAIGSRFAAGTFVFRHGGSGWTREQLLPPKALAIAASGDVIAVAGYPSVNRVYRFDGESWQPDFEFDAIPTSWVALSGDALAIGSSGDDELAGNAGAVHVYRHDGAAWQLEQKLFASDGAAGDALGLRVALEGDRLLALAGGDLDGRRSAYLFGWDGAAWHELEKLAASDGAVTDNFGVGDDAIALTENGAMIGAYGDEDHGVRSGAAYSFRAPEPGAGALALAALAGLAALAARAAPR